MMFINSIPRTATPRIKSRLSIRSAIVFPFATTNRKSAELRDFNYLNLHVLLVLIVFIIRVNAPNYRHLNHGFCSLTPINISLKFELFCYMNILIGLKFLRFIYYLMSQKVPKNKLCFNSISDFLSYQIKWCKLLTQGQFDHGSTLND